MWKLLEEVLDVNVLIVNPGLPPSREGGGGDCGHAYEIFLTVKERGGRILICSHSCAGDMVDGVLRTWDLDYRFFNSYGGEGGEDLGTARPQIPSQEHAPGPVRVDGCGEAW